MENLKKMYYGFQRDTESNELECEETLNKAYQKLGVDNIIDEVAADFEMQGFIRRFKLATQIMADCMGK